jgi:peptidyl-prolyl cis-trans isomerase A (cyclophilin A)
VCKESFVKRILLLALAGAAFCLSSCESAAKNPVVVMETSLGTIKIELNEEKAPITVKNFLTYVDEKFYDGTIFHRVIPDFMIQGGGFDQDLKEKPTHDKIKNEAGNGLKNDKGTIAMARTSDPDSATAQFYINLVDNPGLNRKPGKAGYAVFGKVIEGMDVVEKIGEVETGIRNLDGHPSEDVPLKNVVIKSIRRADKK